MAWKQRPIGGIEVGRAFSVLLITAVTGMYVISTGERVVGALVTLASLALFAAVWIGYRKQHGSASREPRWRKRAPRVGGPTHPRPPTFLSCGSQLRRGSIFHVGATLAPKAEAYDRGSLTNSGQEGEGQEDVDCHEQPQALHPLQVGGSQMGEGRLPAGSRRGGPRNLLSALSAMWQGEPQRRNGSPS